MSQDRRAHGFVVFPQHTHHPFGLGGVGEGSEAPEVPEVNEHHADLAAV